MMRWRQLNQWPVWALVIASSATAADRQSLPDEDLLARQNLHRRWHTQVPILRIREKIKYLKVEDGLIFASSDQGMVHVIDAETGKLNWTATAGELGTLIYQPSATKRVVYVSGGELVKQFDRASGKLNWVKSMPSGVISGAVGNDEFVYVPTNDNKLQAIGLVDEYQRVLTKQPIAWFYYVGAPIENPPILLTDRVVAATRDGRVYAFNLDQRNIIYRYFTKAPIAAPLANWDEKLYVACVDSSIFCVNLNTGETNWRYITGYPISKAPIPFTNEVYVVSDGAGTFCLSNLTGKPRWLNDRAVAILAASENNVYAKDRTGMGLTIDSRDGNILGKFPLPGFSLYADNRFNDRIYVATADGLIICLAERGRDKPFLHSLRPVKTDEAEETPKSSQPERKQGFFDDVLGKGKPRNLGKISKGKADEDEDKPKEKKTKAKSFFDDN